MPEHELRRLVTNLMQCFLDRALESQLAVASCGGCGTATPTPSSAAVRALNQGGGSTTTLPSAMWMRQPSSCTRR
jgi:hypothetical protein